MKIPTRNICILITILLSFVFWETQVVEAQQAQISTCTRRWSKCKYRKPNCNGNGAACSDPCFIGADGSVFYFHGKSNEHFTLVSDHNLHINARFISHQPASRPRGYPWIQALGIMYGRHTLSVQATKAESWGDNVDYLTFSYDGEEITLPEIALLFWNSPESEATIERISRKNSVLVSIKDVLEVTIRVVPAQFCKSGEAWHRHASGGWGREIPN